MTIHYICRGNAFRSIIADAYTKSLNISDLSVFSSGSSAAAHKEINIPTYKRTLELISDHDIKDYAKDHYADDTTQELIDASDMVVCVNQIVFDELVANGLRLPIDTYLWDITDIGEPGRITKDDTTLSSYYEDVFVEISTNIDKLLRELTV